MKSAWVKLAMLHSFENEAIHSQPSWLSVSAPDSRKFGVSSDYVEIGRANPK